MAHILFKHGGRQMDGATGSPDALHEISQAVSGQIAISFDGGIRTGADMCVIYHRWENDRDSEVILVSKL